MMIRINLLPEEYRRKARTPIKLMAGFAAAIAINASLMAYLGWVTFAVAGAVESERSTLQLELDGLTPQVELRVREPRPGGHALDIAGLDHGRVTHAIAVGYLAAHDDGYNLHLLVRVRGEPRPGLDHVVVEDAQGPELDVLRIVVVGEGEEPVRLQPAEIAEVAIPCADRADHGCLRFG